MGELGGDGDGDGVFVSSVGGVVRGWWMVDSQCAGDGTVNGLPTIFHDELIRFQSRSIRARWPSAFLSVLFSGCELRVGAGADFDADARVVLTLVFASALAFASDKDEVAIGVREAASLSEIS